VKLAWFKTTPGKRALNWGAPLLTILALAIAADRALDWLTGLPGVRLQRIVLKGDLNRIDREQLKSTLLAAAKGTFFTVDVQTVQAQVVKLPWVRTAAVRRVWPDRLEVTLEEHQPKARWGAGQLLNSRDEVFAADYAGELPRLAGPPGSEKEVAAKHAEFAALLAPADQKLAETLLSRRRAWQVRLAGGLALALGRERMEERLVRFVAVLQAQPELAGQRGRIDLRYPNGFAVKLAGPKTNEQSTERRKRGT